MVCLNDLNDNHYRIDLSINYLIFSKKVKNAYTNVIQTQRKTRMAKPNVDVAIAILIHANKVLVGWREEHQHQGNKHEFAGGKVEVGEKPIDACRREVREEVGIDLEQWQKFDFIRHEYEDVIVNLHFFSSYVPEHLLEKIQTPWTWFNRNQLQDLNFPKANTQIIKRLYWQPFIKISEKLTHLTSLEDNQLLYWRCMEAENAHREISNYSVEALSKLILNVELWKNLNEMQQNAVAVVHLKQSQVISMTENDLKLGQRYIAACHDLETLKHAEKIGCEAAFLSPVCETETHPEAEGLGWKTFAEMAQQSNMMIYALGGVAPDQLETAITHYAYGVAGIRNF